MIEGVGCVVLAGGESRRMGSDKARVMLVGKTLIARVLTVVRPLFKEVMISVHKGGGGAPNGVKAVTDFLPGRGPAVGICAALEAATDEWLFVVACDHPLISKDLIRHMVSLRGDADMVIPRPEGRPEPMFALYSKRVLGPLTKRVKRGERGLIKFIEEEEALRIRYVDAEMIKSIDPALGCFIDVDDANDLKEAKRLIKDREKRNDENST